MARRRAQQGIESGLKPGDSIYGYVYKGEGVFSAWFNGYWVEDFDGSGVAGAGCNRNCNAKLVKQGHVEWWVQIRTKDGTIGWTKDTDSFDGKDALSGIGVGIAPEALNPRQVIGEVRWDEFYMPCFGTTTAWL